MRAAGWREILDISAATGRSVMKVVVIGGSGLTGRNVVRRLVAQGHDPVPASPSTGVDTITGEGLADVMVGADVVVDVSNAPVWDDDAVMEFFTTSSRNVMAAERDADVGHHVAVSIVGADRLPDSGYLRQGRPGGRDRGWVDPLRHPACYAVLRLPAPDRRGRCQGRQRPAVDRADPVRRRRRRRGDGGRARDRRAGRRALSSWAGPRRWASTPGRGGCSRPPATTGGSSLTHTRGTTARSCTAAS
jgi:hypothetical protein